MTTTSKTTQLRSGVPTGTKVITERGQVPVESLRITDLVLTDSKEFSPVKSIQNRKVKGTYLISAYGQEAISVDERARVCVRDVDIVDENGQPAPIISWPYWVSVNDLDLSKHLVQSPFNPHSINPYLGLTSKLPVSSYTDDQKQLWIQIERVIYSSEATDVFHIELEEDKGVAIEYLAVK